MALQCTAEAPHLAAAAAEQSAHTEKLFSEHIYYLFQTTCSIAILVLSLSPQRVSFFSPFFVNYSLLGNADAAALSIITAAAATAATG